MMNPNLRYLVIEGNIGTGKTSLSKLLAQDYEARLILEQFSDNPFLPLFYQNPERYAFPVELFFMTERHKQLQSHQPEPDLFHQTLISDYVFSKTLLFAGQNLSGDEFSLFRRLFHTLNASFPKPDMLVYLHRPVEELLKQIRLRNRSYEQDISAEYLLKIQQAYFEFFKLQATEFPIILVDAKGLDYVHQGADYERIRQIIEEASYLPAGLHRL